MYIYNETGTDWPVVCMVCSHGDTNWLAMYLVTYRNAVYVHMYVNVCAYSLHVSEARWMGLCGNTGGIVQAVFPHTVPTPSLFHLNTWSFSFRRRLQ